MEYLSTFLPGAIAIVPLFCWGTPSPVQSDKTGLENPTLTQEQEKEESRIAT